VKAGYVSRERGHAGRGFALSLFIVMPQKNIYGKSCYQFVWFFNVTNVVFFKKYFQVILYQKGFLSFFPSANSLLESTLLFVVILIN
jgi:hypothetical protein